jgi:hypothetical protein
LPTNFAPAWTRALSAFQPGQRCHFKRLLTIGKENELFNWTHEWAFG